MDTAYASRGAGGSLSERLPRCLDVPDDRDVLRFVSTVVEGWRNRGNPVSADPATLVAGMGWTLRWERMDAARGGMDALLVPSADGFHVFLDPDPAPPGVRNTYRGAAHFAFRAAHEIAHSFFYDGGRPARRLVPRTGAEERFCDRFASALMRVLPNSDSQ